MNDQKEYKNSSFNIKLPLFLGIALVVGIITGAKFFSTGSTTNDTSKSLLKMKEVKPIEHVVDLINGYF